MPVLDAYVSARDFTGALAALKASRRRPLTGVDPAGCPKILAAILEHWPQPVTGLLEYLSDQILTNQVLDQGDGPLTDRAAHRLATEPGTACRWRHGLLTGWDGTVAAHTRLIWLPGRLPDAARAGLDAGDEPAGVILGRLGAVRTDRHAMPAATGDGPTGAVVSHAVLTAGGAAVAIAKEAITRGFAESLTR